MSLRSLIKSIELITGGVKVIDTDHGYIHYGIYYSYCEYFTLSTGASKFIAFTTPDETYDIHYRPSLISASADKLRILLYEDSVVSGGVSGKSSVYNHNRRSLKTTNIQSLITGITHSTPGTLILQDYIPGGSGVGQSISGASTGQENEWVLKQDTTYVLEITNNSSESNTVNLQLNWYEEEEYNF